MKMRDKFSKYIGIPFVDHGVSKEGCDCYGLVLIVYKEEFGIDLPWLGDSYSHAYRRKDVNSTVKKNIDLGCYIDVTNEPRKPLDIIIFRTGGLETHIGLWVEDGWLLDILEGAHSTIRRYDTSEWKNRITRILRHVDAR